MLAPALGDTGMNAADVDGAGSGAAVALQSRCHWRSTPPILQCRRHAQRAALDPRKHQAFRAVDDPAFFYGLSPPSSAVRRLIGRSVWNTQWKTCHPCLWLAQ